MKRQKPRVGSMDETTLWIGSTPLDRISRAADIGWFDN